MTNVLQLAHQHVLTEIVLPHAQNPAWKVADARTGLSWTGDAVLKNRSVVVCWKMGFIYR